MRNRNLLLLGGIGLALLVIFVGGFFLLFESVEVERRGRLSAEARQDMFLACRRFFDEMGVPARTSLSPRDLPPPGHLLMLASFDSDLSPGEVERLLEWVEQGGKLLAPPDGRLLDALGLAFPDEEEEGEEDSEEVEPAADEAAGDEAAAEEAAASVQLASRPGRVHNLELLPIWRLITVEEGLTPAFVAETEPGSGVALARFDLGSGWVTVFIDPEMFTNSRIGSAEHATFLWSLVTVAGSPAGAMLIYGVDRPSLGELIWKHGWAAVLSALAVLVLWVWRSWPRFGSLLPEPSRDRRSLLEHIRASADFFWRQEEMPRLVLSARQGVLQRAGVRFPGFAQLPSQAKLEHLAGAAEMPLDEVSWALGSQVVGARGGRQGKPDSAETLRLLQILEKVRRSL